MKCSCGSDAVWVLKFFNMDHKDGYYCKPCLPDIRSFDDVIDYSNNSGLCKCGKVGQRVWYNGKGFRGAWVLCAQCALPINKD